MASHKTASARLWALLAIFFALTGCGLSVLPPDRTMLSMSEAALRGLVLTNAPLGMSLADVEQVLAGSFHRKWEAIDSESREMVSQRGFSRPVSSGDYYRLSDIVVHRCGFISSDVITVRFLFGPTHQLKDVAIKKWTDSL